MKPRVSIRAAVVALGLAWALALAAVESPVVPSKGTEGLNVRQRGIPESTAGPDIRFLTQVPSSDIGGQDWHQKQEPKDSEGPDVHDIDALMNIEGPNIP
jgi:hypothetical protein